MALMMPHRRWILRCFVRGDRVKLPTEQSSYQALACNMLGPQCKATIPTCTYHVCLRRNTTC